MSENALDCKGELGRYSTGLYQKSTGQCEWASEILHPCFQNIGGPVSNMKTLLIAQTQSESY